MPGYTFSNRWSIQGTLTTQTPLHLGSGGVTYRNGLAAAGVPIEVSAMPTDVAGSVYIPGSSLKGALRAYAERHAGWWTQDGGRALLDRTFGSGDPNEQSAVAGKLEFCNARAHSDDNAAEATCYAPYWDPARRTAVSASVAIESRTRTAEYRKLFYQEFVPAGVKFRFGISGQNLADDEVALILRCLDGFGEQSGQIALGARTHDGWGVFECTYEAHELDPAGLAQWWADDGGILSVPSPGEVDLDRIRQRAETRFPRSMPTVPRLSMEVRLEFEDGFLVRDHSAATGSPDDHQTPLKNADGSFHLPARSIRGALLAQTQRIANTIALPRAACLVSALFGTTGRRAAIELSNIRVSDARIAIREHVAIDRFTGGVAGSLKFRASVLEEASVDLTLTLNVARLAGAPADLMSSLGVFALLLRDLVEGDVSFGSGGAKGLGACRASIQGLSIGGISQTSETLREHFDEAGLPTDDEAMNAHLGDLVNADENYVELAAPCDAFIDRCLEALTAEANAQNPGEPA